MGELWAAYWTPVFRFLLREGRDPSPEPRDTRFDRQWALTILDRALTALENELMAAGKREHFDELKPWLVGESGALTSASAGQALGLNEGAAKVATHRLRKRFRALVREEVARTVSDSSEVDAELQYFVEVLASPRLSRNPVGATARGLSALSPSRR